jgi:hypothetical protein
VTVDGAEWAAPPIPLGEAAVVLVVRFEARGAELLAAVTRVLVARRDGITAIAIAASGPAPQASPPGIDEAARAAALPALAERAPLPDGTAALRLFGAARQGSGWQRLAATGIVRVSPVPALEPPAAMI